MQMYAASSGAVGFPHFSQVSFISSAKIRSFRCGGCGRAYPLRSAPQYVFFMHKGNSIIMHAPRQIIFETAANLELWPKILPHYRYIRYLERSPERNVVVMAAIRSGIPISWTSEQIIDREQLEVRFHHLKAWTKGMRVVWTFKETPAGVLVEILHDLHFASRRLRRSSNRSSAISSFIMSRTKPCAA